MPSLISRNRENRVVTFNATVAADAVDRNVFVAPDHYIVEEIKAVWTTAGTSSAAVKVKKCTGTTAPASGTELHSTAIDLTGTAQTVATPTLTAAAADRRLKPGDRLALDFSGTQAATPLLTVTIFLRPVARYR